MKQENNTQDFESQFVTFEHAEKLKKLGFRGKCTKYGYYYGDTWEVEPATDDAEYGFDFNISDNTISVPLRSQARAFFREEFGFIGIVSPFEKADYLEYRYTIYFLCKTFDPRPYMTNKTVSVSFSKYEEAENACIERLIEIAES
jgi:hypothetical protein